MSKAPGDLEPGAVASALRQRTAAGREDDSTGAEVALVGGDAEAALGFGAISVDGPHAGDGCDRHAGVARRADERVEDVACAVRVGKQLAVLFLVKPHADIAEECDGLVDRQAPEHTSNDRPSTSPEIGVGHAGVRDVAPRSPADQDFRAELSRPVQNEY